MPIEVRQATESDIAYVERSLTTAFSSTLVAVHGELIDASTLPAAIAWADGAPAGLLTYRITTAEGDGAEWEVVSIAADRPGSGAGTALLSWIQETATRAGAARIWLVTTNDNIDALRFYQRRGFDLVRVHRDAVTRARLLKPTMPLSSNGIPMRHEVEFELRIAGA